jgi:carbonic anhydrase
MCCCRRVSYVKQSHIFSSYPCLFSPLLHRYRLHRAELDAIQDPEARHRRLVELNVVEQCINLFKTGVVQRRRVQTFEEKLAGKTSGYTTPRIHACVFDPKTGEMNRLQVSRDVTKGANA